MEKTKIICTIGPASLDEKILSALIEKGMDIARLNFSHGTHEEFLNMIKIIRKYAKKYNRNVSIMQDLMGLKIRVGNLDSKIKVKTEDTIIFDDSIEKYENDKIPVQYKDFHKDININDRFFVCDGKIEFQVINKDNHKIYAKALNEGIIEKNKGINLPFSQISANTLTNKDLKDLEFGLKNDVDFVTLSFVQEPNDIFYIKDIIKRYGKNTKVIAKIERKQALDNLAEIIKISDGVMVARGDLGVEMSLEVVPVIQKDIIKLCNYYNKPVIVATQMLYSMVKKPTPTRAEVSDIANTVYDKADAVLLSDETSIGKYPLQAMDILCKTLKITEMYLPEAYIDTKTFKNNLLSIINNIYDKDISNIILFLSHTNVPLSVIKYKPNLNFIVFTDNEQTKRELSLFWGINTIFMLDNFKHKIRKSIDVLKREDILKIGDKTIFISLDNKYESGKSTEIRIFHRTV